jgi:hypothetical protein
MANEGEADRDTDEPLDVDSGGRKGNEGGDIVGFDRLADGCEPTEISTLCCNCRKRF